MTKSAREKNSSIESGIGKLRKKVFYSEAVFGKLEKEAVLKSMANKWLASGPSVKLFEIKIAKLFGKKYAVAVNSGSSANLLTLQSLNLPKDSEVITPACTFSTTASSIIHAGFIPVFVDCIIGRYTIDEDLIKNAISEKTKIIMIPQLIGGVCDMPKIKKLAKKYNLILIDDSCDTIAPKIYQKTVASYSDVTTTSFYGSHIITALGMGGMILTDSKKIRDRCIMFRDWGRVGDDYEEFEKRFDFKIDNIPFDAKFLYGNLGYNFKLNEASAAFGLAQLKRLKQFLKQRDDNFNQLNSYFRKHEKWFHLPYLLEGAQTNWLAFPLTIRTTAPFTRYEILKHFESRGIQTRVLFSGNITRHPAYKIQNIRIASKLNNSDLIMASSFLLGCHQGLNNKHIKYITESAEIFLKRFRQ